MVHIRWQIRRDMEECLACLFGWTEEEILALTRQPSVIALVAEVRTSSCWQQGWERVVGCMIYEMRLHSLDVLAFDVHPSFRGRGVGEAMMATLKAKLCRHRRRQLAFWVPDNDLGAHLFLKSQGFRAEVILHEPTGDEYAFVYRVPQESL